jgi:hypothetical protein
VPSFIILAIMQLYTDSQRNIVFLVKVFSRFAVEGGITQGCCLSGPLFAIVMDAFLRTVYVKYEKSVSMRALFDDTSMVFRNARRDGPPIMRLFALFALCSGLCPNMAKGVAIPLWT